MGRLAARLITIITRVKCSISHITRAPDTAATPAQP